MAIQASAYRKSIVDYATKAEIAACLQKMNNIPTLEQADDDFAESDDEYSIFLVGILKGITERDREGPFGSIA